MVLLSTLPDRFIRVSLRVSGWVRVWVRIRVGNRGVRVRVRIRVSGIGARSMEHYTDFLKIPLAKSDPEPESTLWIE